MNILLINPPNCGRSIPEERYGITSLKWIFRGEPLALEELAGNLDDHDVRILDLKAEPAGLEGMLNHFTPDVVGLTGVTCEANTVLSLCQDVKAACNPVVVVGGIHASNDPHFFNQASVDYIIAGQGKKTFAELTARLEQGQVDNLDLPGVFRTCPDATLAPSPYRNTLADLVEEKPPAYALVSHYRSHYILESLGITMGFVLSAQGCPHRCGFCSINRQTGGSYLSKSIETVLREIKLHTDTPVIRLVDANTFGDIAKAKALGRAILEAELGKHFLADVRSDTVVRYPEVLREWKEAGLRAVVIGFEEIDDTALSDMNKANCVQTNTEAIHILNELGIKIVGDFIISPTYAEQDFYRLDQYLSSQTIDLPMITVLTPLPGTPLYRQMQAQITNHNLDYYTLTNAVTPTTLKEQDFYHLYASLLEKSHNQASL